MFSADEDSSVLAYLFGLIALVMVAVGLSLVMDRRFKFANDAGLIQQELKLGDAEIAELTAAYKNLVQQHEESEGKLQGGSQTYFKLSASLETQQQLRATLIQTRSELNSAVTSLEQDFSQARNDYRRKTWSAAVGKTLGDLAVRGERVYRQATISRVTEVGLEIRHEHGFARIQAPDLDLKWQEKFQWDDEERQRSLQTERTVQESPPNESVKVREIESGDTNSTPGVRDGTLQMSVTEDLVKINALRKKVSAWKQKVGILKGDKAEADSQTGYGNNRSVPGSLETWEARAGRLTQDLAQAKAALELAKAQLAVVAPTDFLLQQEAEN
jgi:hypothetical protein